MSKSKSQAPKPDQEKQNLEAVSPNDQVEATTDTEETKDESKSQAPKPEDNAQLMVTVEQIRTSHTENAEDPRLVKIVAAYPEDWKGDKHLQDGKEYKVSPETADQFIKAGIAKKMEE
jgi:hypothetical protein